MHLSRKPPFLGMLFLGAVTLVSVAGVKPAHAFSFTSSSATFSLSDPVGTSFDVTFPGAIDSGANIPGLSAKANFQLLNLLTPNSANFKITLSNTSTSPVTASRLVGIGFDTSTGASPLLTSATVTQGSGPPVASTIPGKFPAYTTEVCFTFGSFCTGGGGNGLLINNSNNGGNPAVFNAVLGFSPPDLITSVLTLDNFSARYQAITAPGLNGASAVAKGTGVVPTPAMLPGLIGMGIAAWRKKSKKDKEEQDISSLA